MSVADLAVNKHYSTSDNIQESSGIAGFARTLEKLQQSKTQADDRAVARSSGYQDKHESFATLLRNSPLMQLGDPKNKVVIGTIIDVVDKDLYIDFGGKFHVVCRRPGSKTSYYRRGTQVKVKLHDMELASRFLNAPKDITLLEASGTLIGLYNEKAATDNSSDASWSVLTIGYNNDLIQFTFCIVNFKD